MKKFKLALATFVFATLSTVAVLSPVPVGAVNALDDVCSQSGSNDNPICQNSNEQAEPLIKTLVNVLLFIVGALAVVMLIWSGISYVTSTGDSGRIKRAKDTLTYSIVGLIVASLAFVIVNYVVNIF